MRKKPEPVEFVVPPSDFPKTAEGVHHAVCVAAPAIAAVINAALPTASIRRALVDEVRRALQNPSGVAHPELADPNVYWRTAAEPQGAAVTRRLRGIADEVSAELQRLVETARPEFEQWLRGRVREMSDSSSLCRDEVIDEIAARCGALDAVIAGIERIVPAEQVSPLRAEAAAARAKEVQSLARRTGESPDRVDAQLAAEAPHRHVELLLDAHARVHQVLRHDIEQTIAAARDLIFSLGHSMVRLLGELQGQALSSAGP